MAEAASHSLRVAGLFAGVGGIELGLAGAGHQTRLLCEIDPGARHVLRDRFPKCSVHDDVTAMNEPLDVDLVAAGFPCQDLSQAGRKSGITGSKSSLVSHVFRLLALSKEAGRMPPFVMLENVSYMLNLGGGSAMQYLVDSFEDLGYSWAYRVVDARAFGVPQRRRRVVFLASTEVDPSQLILDPGDLEDSSRDAIGEAGDGDVYGFYWTEGKRGLGWTKNAIPTLKGGSSIGIPSAPAIWTPASRTFGTPTLEDAERLQGFPTGWTEPADAAYPKPRRFRWRLVGNAVCVPVARWAGEILATQTTSSAGLSSRATRGKRWPSAGYGHAGKRFCVEASRFPVSESYDIQGFLAEPLIPLSERAASGFLKRTGEGKLRFPEAFLEDLHQYVGDGFSVAA